MLNQVGAWIHDVAQTNFEMGSEDSHWMVRPEKFIASNAQSGVADDQ